MKSNGWTPVTNDSPNPFNERLKDYRHAAPWTQFLVWLAGIIIILLIVFLIFRAAWLDARHIIIPDVITPVATWMS